ncbi:hypothetical protein, partial [Gemmiger gallinarum]|uniref:hypothetical protein n=1 Tax=Gemmiger gallinarum TaxID=2779354 RepID=UPI001A9ADD42
MDRVEVFLNLNQLLNRMLLQEIEVATQQSTDAIRQLNLYAISGVHEGIFYEPSLVSNLSV